MQDNVIDLLHDINDIHIDRTLQKTDKILDYFQQIKNPYIYRNGKYIVEVNYATEGLSIRDCVENLVKHTKQKQE